MGLHVVMSHTYNLSHAYLSHTHTIKHPTSVALSDWRQIGYTVVLDKLAVDHESTPVDLLTADGEYLYTAAAALTVCTALL